jgi:nucleolar protein 58
LAKTDPDDIHKKFFSSVDDASSFVNLVSFQPFIDTADAVSAATSCIEGKVSKSLKSFLKKQMKKDLKGEQLAVADKTLAVDMKSKFDGLDIVHDAKTNELFRGIRCYLGELLESSTEAAPSSSDIRAMQLGLSHSLGRYKLKFSADKVDTMVIQAVGLLDELDKEINTYAMRVKEWYGWHFPGASQKCVYVLCNTYIIIFM